MAQNTKTVTVEDLVAGMMIDLEGDSYADTKNDGQFDYEKAEIHSFHTETEFGDKGGKVAAILVSFIHQGAEIVVAFPAQHRLNLG